MTTCPHCEAALELSVEPEPVTVHREDERTTIEPDVFSCRACGAVLFATVSRELEDGDDER